jgi:hypothetical protein
MNKLSNTEKEAILYCQKEYSKWFIANKIKLSESNKKFKDFTLLVFQFFMLRFILRKHMFEKYDLNFYNVGENIEFAAIFGVDGLCKPALIHLENERFFWGYFGYIIFCIELPSLELIKLKNSTLPFVNKKYSIDKKSSAYQAFMYANYIFTHALEADSELQVINNFKKNISNHCEEILEASNGSKEYFHNAIGNSEKIKIYRGFNYSEELNVRTGRYLKNNPTSHIQDDGKSISFTLERKIAKDFAVNYFGTGSLVAEWSRRVNGNELLLKMNNFNTADFLKEQKRRPVIGTYEVAINDILLYSCFPERSEYEILVFPENTRLIRYDNVKYS